jgi:hypothetical protein
MLRHRLPQFTFVSVMLVLALVVSAGAQKITGDISGTVTDPTGAAVAGASITVTNPATGLERTATTNDTGSYRFVELPPGRYRLSVTAQGFKTVNREAEVSLGLVTSADFQLPVGATGESVTVEDVIPLVQTADNRLNTLVETRRIDELPLNGRDFNSLLTVIPGVYRSPGGGFLSVTVNGNRATNNNFAVDGIPNNDRYYGDAAVGETAILGTAATLVPLEAVSEFMVQGSPSAEYGVKGGSVINIGLKSGTNDFHGNATWLRHSDHFDAKNFFSDERTPIRLNQFGGLLSGRIIRDKTFFVVSYQGFRLKDFFPYEASVPTPDAVATAQACIANGGPDCFNPTPGPGSDQIFGTADDGTPSQIGAALLSFYPLDPSGVVSVNSPNRLDIDNYYGKIDHVFNDRHRISLKYVMGDSFQTQPAFAGTIVPVPPNPPDMFNSIAPSRAQLGGLSWHWAMSPNKVLETRVGATRFSQIIDVNNKVDPRSLGLDTGPLEPGDFGVPTLYYLGYYLGYIGGVTGYPITTAPNQTYDVQSHFTWSAGNHTVKLGGQFQNAYTNSLRNRARTNITMGYTVSEPGPLAIEQLLLGWFDIASRSFGNTRRRISQDSYGVYLQDNWKIRPNLNVEFGLRYDITTPLDEDQDRGSNFLPDDPEADAAGFVHLSQRDLYEIDKDNFGPRVGVAWDIWGDGKAVFRSGYAINYDVPTLATIHAPQVTGIFGGGARGGAYTQPAQGVFGVQLEFATPAENQAIFFNNPNCAFLICAAPNVPLFGSSPTPLTSNVMQVVPDFQVARIQTWNATVEMGFTEKTSLNLSYVGTKATDLPSWRDLNASPLGSGGTGGCTPGTPEDFQFRPFFARFGETICHIVQLNDDGHSRYDSLQASYKFRDLWNFTGAVNLTWSSAFDTGSANRGSSFDGVTPCQNPYNVECNWARADFDVPLNFNVSFVYDVPRWGALPRVISEGWQINTLFQAVDGRPFTPRVTFDESGQGLSGNRAAYDGSPLNYDYENPDEFFNTAGFSDPAPDTIGNAGRNSVRRPGLVQLDASLFKNTKIGERFNVQFRWEVFNVLNRANFEFRTGNINSSSFGRFRETADTAAFNPILGTGAARNMQFGLRLQF